MAKMRWSGFLIGVVAAGLLAASFSIAVYAYYSLQNSKVTFNMDELRILSEADYVWSEGGSQASFYHSQSDSAISASCYLRGGYKEPYCRFTFAFQNPVNFNDLESFSLDIESKYETARVHVNALMPDSRLVVHEVQIFPAAGDLEVPINALRLSDDWVQHKAKSIRDQQVDLSQVTSISITTPVNAPLGFSDLDINSITLKSKLPEMTLALIVIDAIWIVGAFSVVALLTLRYRKELKVTKLLHSGMKSIDLIDSESGLINRKAARKVFNVLIDNKSRFHLIMFDIDHFNTFASSFGASDTADALNEIGDIFLKNTKNEVDYCVRWEAGKVLIITSRLSGNVEGFANNIRRKIEKASLSCGGKLTVSVGISNYRSRSPNKHQTKEERNADISKNISDAITRAELGVAEAQDQGRNAVCFYGNTGQQRVAFN